MNGILKKVGFSRSSKPFLEYVVDDQVLTRDLHFGESLAFEFDFATQFCTGWYDMEARECFYCAEHKTGAEQCYHCMQKSGFNPAFYNASSVSPQQEKRNQEPHNLYLAYFGGDFVKVGIAHGERNLARLLEQGARAAIVLDEMPTALVARNYEARIAAMTNFVESVRINKKVSLLHEVFDPDQAKTKLTAAQKLICSELKTDFSDQILQLDKYYSYDPIPTTFTDDLSEALRQNFSGKLVALVGSLMILDNHDRKFLIDAKILAGYKFSSSDIITEMDLPAEQLGLF